MRVVLRLLICLVFALVGFGLTRAAFGSPSLLGAMKALPVFHEDREDPELKAVQLADMALAIDHASGATFRPAGIERKDWEALLGTVSYHESTWSIRIAKGGCKPDECDGGNARGPWQQWKNQHTEAVWEQLHGLEFVQVQAETASASLLRAYKTCERHRAEGQWLRTTLNAYAGKRCGADWPGSIEREQTWSKLRRRM